MLSLITYVCEIFIKPMYESKTVYIYTYIVSQRV